MDLCPHLISAPLLREGYECYDGRQPTARHKWKEAAALSRARLLFSPTLNTESVNGKCK